MYVKKRITSLRKNLLTEPFERTVTWKISVATAKQNSFADIFTRVGRYTHPQILRQLTVINVYAIN